MSLQVPQWAYDACKDTTIWRPVEPEEKIQECDVGGAMSLVCVRRDSLHGARYVTTGPFMGYTPLVIQRCMDLVDNFMGNSSWSPNSWWPCAKCAPGEKRLKKKPEVEALPLP